MKKWILAASLIVGSTTFAAAQQSKSSIVAPKTQKAEKKGIVSKKGSVTKSAKSEGSYEAKIPFVNAAIDSTSVPKGKQER